MREAKALSRINPAAFPLRTVVWQLGIRPLVPESAVRIWHAMQPAHHSGDDTELISRQLLEKLRSNASERTASRDASIHSDAKTSHKRALNSPLIPYGMEFADAASSAFGLEVRYPFFDRRLIEFCLAIPAMQKLQNGWTRSVMRRAMTGILPAEIQWRTGKADLSPNFARSLFERDLETIRDVVCSRLNGLQDYINLREAQAVFQRWATQPVRRGQDGLTLFALTTLALWFEQARADAGAC
jgi:asparagine synthase (glutamine-hydrolysing)